MTRYYIGWIILDPPNILVGGIDVERPEICEGDVGEIQADLCRHLRSDRVQVIGFSPYAD